MISNNGVIIIPPNLSGGSHDSDAIDWFNPLKRTININGIMGLVIPAIFIFCCILLLILWWWIETRPKNNWDRDGDDWLGLLYGILLLIIFGYGLLVLIIFLPIYFTLGSDKVGKQWMIDQVLSWQRNKHNIDPSGWGWIDTIYQRYVDLGLVPPLKF